MISVTEGEYTREADLHITSWEMLERFANLSTWRTSVFITLKRGDESIIGTAYTARMPLTVRKINSPMPSPEYWEGRRGELEREALERISVADLLKMRADYDARQTAKS